MLPRFTYFVLISSGFSLSVVMLTSAACYRNASVRKTGVPPPIFLSRYNPLDILLSYFAVRNVIIVTLTNILR